MITQVVQDSNLWTGKRNASVGNGTPVKFLNFSGARHPSYPRGPEMAEVQLSDGTVGILPLQSVGSGASGSEETLRGLSGLTGQSYNTLIRAARQGRLLARKSGNHYLSTVRAVEYAIETGAMRAPKDI